jgi:hypothetical protein
LCALLAAAPLAWGVIIDQIAVSVGDRVITTSDIDREIRVNAFLNGSQPDSSPAGKRATAERMVEQQLIRRELETSRYPVPRPAEVEPVLAEFIQAHYHDHSEYEGGLTQYGIKEQDVKDELLWQRTLLLFIEVRFRPGIQVTDQDIQEYFEKTVKPAAQAAHPNAPVSLEDFRDQIEQALTGQRVDQQVDTWLKAARRRTEIVYHDEVFQ